MTLRTDYESDLDVERRLSWLFAVGGCILILDQTIFTIDELVLWSRWWNVGATMVVAGILTLAAGSLHLPSRVLRALWVGIPILYAALLFLWVFAAHDPTEIESSPWIVTLEPAVATMLVLVVRPIVAVGVSLGLFALPALSGMLFLGHLPVIVSRDTPAQLSDIIYVVVFIGIYAQLKQLRAEEMEARTQQRRRIHTAAMAAEQVRVSRIVHDEVLSAMAAAIQTEGNPPMVLKRAAAGALSALDESIGSPMLSLDHSESTQTAYGRIVADLRAIDHGFTLDSDLGSGKIRVEATNAATLAAAEALRNSKRHAGEGAERLVFLRLHDNSIRISVSDDGVGFDADVAHDGLGIPQSIKQRMQEVGGLASVSSRPGQGTEVTILWRI